MLGRAGIQSRRASRHRLAGRRDHDQTGRLDTASDRTESGVPKDDDTAIRPEPDRDPSEPAGSVKDKAVTAAKKARGAVRTAKTAAKDSAAGAFDKVIDSLDSLGQKRDRTPDA
jgi:hypothetical protein